MSDIASINDLTELLMARAETDEVLFEAGGDTIGLGYHLTEFRLARIASIDCGGARDHWVEAQMQVLDAPGDAAMNAGKMAAILARSTATIEGLADAPLSVEFSAGNQGLGRYRIAAPRAAEGAITLPLTPIGPECKAMLRAFQKPETSACGDKPARRAGCC